MRTRKLTVFCQLYSCLSANPYFSKITLAIALDNTVREHATEEDYQNIYVEQTQKAFAFIGGIAFLTLSINGTTAGPILRTLGLADSTESREKIVSAYQARFTAHLIGASSLCHCSWFCYKYISHWYCLIWFIRGDGETSFSTKILVSEFCLRKASCSLPWRFVCLDWTCIVRISLPHCCDNL